MTDAVSPLSFSLFCAYEQEMREAVKTKQREMDTDTIPARAFTVSWILCPGQTEVDFAFYSP